MANNNSTSSAETIARLFSTLSDRLTRAAATAVKSQHLARDISDYEVQAGRLLVQAIDAGLFPKERAEQNRAWWNRPIARMPGGPTALYGSVPAWAWVSVTFEEAGLVIQNPNYDPNAEERIRADAMKPYRPAQYARCWVAAIGSWLAMKFPEHFRHNAASWDWWHAATDKDGRPLGKDGRPLVGRWYWKGKRMPANWKPPFARNAEKPPAVEEQVAILDSFSDTERRELSEQLDAMERNPQAAQFHWKLEGDIAGTTDFYDEADWLAHQRIRAETHADACRLLADIIGIRKSHEVDIAIDVKPKRGKHRRKTREPKPPSRRQKQAIDLADRGFSVSAIAAEMGVGVPAASTYLAEGRRRQEIVDKSLERTARTSARPRHALKDVQLGRGEDDD